MSFLSIALRNYSAKNESLRLFAAAAGHSYSCKAVSVYMGQGVHLDFTKSRVQAFNIKNKEFGKSKSGIVLLSSGDKYGFVIILW